MVYELDSSSKIFPPLCHALVVGRLNVSIPALPSPRQDTNQRDGVEGKTGMIDVNGKNNKVEQKNNKKTKTMGDVTLKGYDMTNTVTKGTGVRVHKQ